MQVTVLAAGRVMINTTHEVLTLARRVCKQQKLARRKGKPRGTRKGVAAICN